MLSKLTKAIKLIFTDILHDHIYSRLFLFIGGFSYWLWAVFVTPLSGPGVIDFGRIYVLLLCLAICFLTKKQYIVPASFVGFTVMMFHYFYMIYLNFGNQHKFEYLTGLTLILALCNLVFVCKAQVYFFYGLTFITGTILLSLLDEKFPVVTISHMFFACLLSTLGAVIRIQLISHLKKKTDENSHLQEGLLHSLKLASLGEMAGGIAHEINNPVQVILGFTQQQLRLSPDDKRLGRILESTMRIAKIVEAVRKISEGAEVEESKSEIYVAQLIEGAVNLCQERIKLNGIELRIDFGADFEIQVQNAEMVQVMLNLLNNAIDAIQANKKASLQSSQIHIQSIEVEGELHIRVSDSGPPIPQFVVNRLFQPFFTTKPPGAGIGLGLATSRKIVENNNGRLFFSKENKEFIIVLPYKKQADKNIKHAA